MNNIWELNGHKFEYLGLDTPFGNVRHKVMCDDKNVMYFQNVRSKEAIYNTFSEWFDFEKLKK